ncbi:MAG: type I pullulanase [Lachnospiraceae bacterium]|nr:type I pullulanase [Lachnospiraceae bacterium]
MRKKLRKVSALVSAFIMVLSIFSGIRLDAMAAGETKVSFHYYRSDGKYSDWDVWFWADGVDGTAGKFQKKTDKNGCAVTSFTVPAGGDKLSFIVRKGGDSWAGKDVDKDQSIDLSAAKKGKLDVYVFSGIEGYATKFGNTVAQASSASKTSISVTMMKAFDKKTDAKKAFSVTNSVKKKFAISKVKAAKNVYTLTLKKPISYRYTTYVTYDGVKTRVTTPDYYSTKEFEKAYTYTGNDLGASYKASATTFRLWAPLASKVKLNLYKSGRQGADDLIKTVSLKKKEKGTWSVKVAGDQNGVYYTYDVTTDGRTAKDVIDPYARTSGTNGKRGMVIDLSSTDPAGWKDDKNPNEIKNYTDAVIYELHVGDFSNDKSSGMKNKGKYLAFTEKGTKNSSGQTTGIDYLKDLGVTHVQLQPVYDFSSVDESKDTDQYNWGYDPENYNIPEGSYSTDPSKGAVRVKEFKEMVESLHQNGMSVVMDVVYGHVASKDNFCINRIVPDYYSRPNSNGSFCGNDTATERAMNRKYIVDSFVYWAKEYHINGFRIDQSYLFDTKTMNQIVKALHEIDPSIIIYGEGWNNETNPTKTGLSFATQNNSAATPQVGYFNDQIRDGAKGGVFNFTERGYASGNSSKASDIRQSVTASASWLKTENRASQTINYVSCHDNDTLFDRLQGSSKAKDRSELIAQNNLASSIVFLSEGIPFMQGGEEMLRSKELPSGVKHDESNDIKTVNGRDFWVNSYSSNASCLKAYYEADKDFSASSINAFKWDNLGKKEYQDVYNYYKGLISFRKAHPALRMTSGSEIDSSVKFLSGTSDNVIAYTIDGKSSGDSAQQILVIFNPNQKSEDISLPSGDWKVCIDKQTAGTRTLKTASGSISAEAESCTVLIR